MKIACQPPFIGSVSRGGDGNAALIDFGIRAIGIILVNHEIGIDLNIGPREGNMFSTGRLNSNVAKIPNIIMNAIRQVARICKTDEVTRHNEFMGKMAGKIRRDTIRCDIGGLAGEPPESRDE